ncbi:MAG: type III secretion protein [Candidatus Protochlamydia sp.]|nr:type III secretion protein [Candidatus Protochlamydia sp.]
MKFFSAHQRLFRLKYWLLAFACHLGGENYINSSDEAQGFEFDQSYRAPILNHEDFSEALKPLPPAHQFVENNFEPTWHSSAPGQEIKQSQNTSHAHSLSSFLSGLPVNEPDLVVQADPAANDQTDLSNQTPLTPFSAPLPMLKPSAARDNTPEGDEIPSAATPARKSVTTSETTTTRPTPTGSTTRTTTRTTTSQAPADLRPRTQIVEPAAVPEIPISIPSNALPPRPNPSLSLPIEPAERVRTIISPVPPTSIPIQEVGSINFNNVAMVEYIRFVSRISNKNFIFDDEDLQFNVTIVSEEPTTVDNLMAALLQELRIHDLYLMEQGNNVIIHRNPRVKSPSRIISDGLEPTNTETELVTRVFRLNTLDPIKASEIIRPLLSDDALVEVLRDSNNIILTDLVSSVNKIADLISVLDAPNSGVTVGQYVVRNSFVESLSELASKLLQPIAQGNPFILVPHAASNSIFIVSNPFLVEKALAVMENLDINEGKTKILSLEKLRFQNIESGPGYGPGGPGYGPGRLGGVVEEGTGGFRAPASGGLGLREVDQYGNPLRSEGNYPGSPAYTPGLTPQSIAPQTTGGQIPPGQLQGQIPGQTPQFPGQIPGPFVGPGQGGIGIRGREGAAIFTEQSRFMPGGIGTNPRWIQDLPAGHIERTLFFIYKLRYRRGDQLEIALRRIAESMAVSRTANLDLIAAINSSQWLEGSNSIIFTGTIPALERVKELILEVDIPLHQVFIEMLILDTSITDSLNYAVDFGTRFGGPELAGGQNFLGTGAALAASLLSSEVVGGIPGVLTAGNLLSGNGYTAGVIGRTLSHGGLEFNSIAALVRAVHTDGKTNIILNPKIITEDNNTAEVFVGSTDRYKTQSIANAIGGVVTNNFQFIDVGTTLRVTPLIGNNGIITLDIVQEVTNDAGGANAGNPNDVDFNLIPVLSKSRTVTRIHVPNGFFVILSGMIQGNETRAVTQIPCLGGIPIIGGLSKNKANIDNRRNLMIFIRPLIVDTDEELENITKRQQDVFREKSKWRRRWNYEIDEALDFFSIRPTDPDEIGCTVK